MIMVCTTTATTSQYGNDADQKHACAIFLLACLHIKKTNCCATNHERWKNISAREEKKNLHRDVCFSCFSFTQTERMCVCERGFTYYSQTKFLLQSPMNTNRLTRRLC